MHTVPSRCGQCGSHCGPTWPVLTEYNLGCSRTGLKLDSENRVQVDLHVKNVPQGWEMPGLCRCPGRRGRRLGSHFHVVCRVCAR